MLSRGFIEGKPRKIVIKSLKLLSFEGNLLSFEVICSRGTYVRTLGEDIANRLNTVGHLISLKRTAVGNVNLDSAVDVDDLKESDLVNPIHLISLPKIEIKDEKLIQDIKNGKTIKLDNKEENVLLYIKENNELIPLAVYNRKEGDVYSPLRGLW